jgi:hypothetical protein
MTSRLAVFSLIALTATSVAGHALSTDGHKTTGSFSFTVKP